MSGGQRIEDWLAREENNVRFVFLGNQATPPPSAQRFSLDSPSSPFPVSIRRPDSANRRGCTSSSKREHQELGRLEGRPSPCLDINVRSLYYLFLDSPSAFSLFLPLPSSPSLLFSEHGYTDYCTITEQILEEDSSTLERSRRSLLSL